jgi:DHA1 family bicyclomycin/chloramphenicol resistance-like MFS transporter
MLLALAISLAGYGSAVKFFGLCTFVGIGNGLVMPNATAGMLSVRPHLAGTASGLGSAILIGGGAALSAFAGVVLGWGTGDAPLLIIMAISACLGYISIRFVVAREKRLATTDPLPD